MAENRIKTQIVRDFKELQESLQEITDTYDINITRMCKHVGMSKPTYYKKKQELGFTADEMKKICEYINK